MGEEQVGREGCLLGCRSARGLPKETPDRSPFLTVTQPTKGSACMSPALRQVLEEAGVKGPSSALLSLPQASPAHPRPGRVLQAASPQRPQPVGQGGQAGLRRHPLLLSWMWGLGPCCGGPRAWLHRAGPPERRGSGMNSFFPPLGALTLREGPQVCAHLPTFAGS